MLLQDLPWPEIRDLIAQSPTVIVPIGSTEQHGPHLPVKTDYGIIDKLAAVVGEKTHTLVAPAIPYSYAELWHDYPGTISISSAAFRAYVHDVCASLIRTGFRRILLLNGHNPNQLILQPLAYDLVNEFGGQDITVAAATYIVMAQEECEQLGEYFRDGSHANEAETSLMLTLYPDLVRMDRLSEVEEFAPRRLIVYHQGAAIVNRWPQNRRHSGVYGNPAAASREKGQSYWEVLTDKIAQFVLEFREGKLNPAAADGTPLIR